MKLRHDPSMVIAKALPGVEFCLHGDEIRPLKSELVTKKTGKQKLVKYGLEIISNHPYPNEEQLEAAQVELDAELYLRHREREYRALGHSPRKFMMAFVEKEEGEPSAWNKLMSERKDIKERYKKGV